MSDDQQRDDALAAWAESDMVLPDGSTTALRGAAATEHGRHLLEAALGGQGGAPSLDREALAEAVFEVCEKYDLPLTNNVPRTQDGVRLRPIGDFIADLASAYAAALTASREDGRDGGPCPASCMLIYAHRHCPGDCGCVSFPGSNSTERWPDAARWAPGAS